MIRHEKAERLMKSVVENHHLMASGGIRPSRNNNQLGRKGIFYSFPFAIKEFDSWVFIGYCADYVIVSCAFLMIQPEESIPNLEKILENSWRHSNGFVSRFTHENQFDMALANRAVSYEVSADQIALAINETQMAAFIYHSIVETGTFPASLH